MSEPSSAQHRPTRPADWQLPFGVDRALWEYLSTPRIATEYDATFASTNLIQTDQEYLARWCERPGRLLDLGCGTGRVIEAFARRGFECVGVDLSAEMLGVTRKKLQASGLHAELLEGNLCELGMLDSESFAYACCMFSTLGMLKGQPARDRAVAEAYRVLEPGGLFVLHLHNRYYNLRDPQGRLWVLADLWRWVLRHPEAGDKVQPSYRGIPNLRLHLFSRREIRRLLRRHGFEQVELVPLAPDRADRLPHAWWLESLRANGWLIRARRPR